MTLTDAEIIAIRDEHLPSQGEPFDCLAFGRAIVAATIERCAKEIEPRSPPEDWTEYAEIKAECAAAIRALAKP